MKHCINGAAAARLNWQRWHRGRRASLTKWHFPLEKRCGNFSIKGGFYKCTQDWRGWATGMGWTFRGPFQPQLFHGQQEAAALSVPGIPFLLFPRVLWHHCSPHKAAVSIFCGINWLKTRIGLDVFKTRSIMNSAALIWEKNLHCLLMYCTYGLSAAPQLWKWRGRKRRRDFFSMPEWLWMKQCKGCEDTEMSYLKLHRPGLE